MTHVIIFGDSVAYGLFDPSGGWVQRVRAQVDRRNIAENGYWTHVYNLAVSGDTAADLLGRIETELPARRDSESAQKNVVLFALGINDSAYLINERRARFTDEEFRSNLQSLVGAARKHADKIGFISPFLVNQSAVDPVPWATDMAYRNSLIRNFNMVIQSLCLAEGFDYVDLLTLWSDGEAKRYLQDGVHPNVDGHALIAGRVSELFKKYDLV
jgi:lysophospholipase L1-like esterase